jgi:hypothetical protein
MQSVAVMLLDLAYRAKSEKTDNSETILALKKLMEWLRAMQHNDPVADRAYQIVRKIIQTSGPAFQEITRVLLTEDTKPSPGTQSSSRNDSHNDRMYEFRQGDAWLNTFGLHRISSISPVLLVILLSTPSTKEHPSSIWRISGQIRDFQQVWET